MSYRLLPGATSTEETWLPVGPEERIASRSAAGTERQSTGSMSGDPTSCVGWGHAQASTNVHRTYSHFNAQINRFGNGGQRTLRTVLFLPDDIACTNVVGSRGEQDSLLGGDQQRQS